MPTILYFVPSHLLFISSVPFYLSSISSIPFLSICPLVSLLSALLFVLPFQYPVPFPFHLSSISSYLFLLICPLFPLFFPFHLLLKLSSRAVIQIHIYLISSFSFPSALTHHGLVHVNCFYIPSICSWHIVSVIYGR